MGKNHFSFVLVLLGLTFIGQNALADCNKTIDELSYAGTWFPKKYDPKNKGCVETIAGGFFGNIIGQELKGLAAQAAAKCFMMSVYPISYGNSEFGGGGSNHMWACASSSAETIKIDICNNLAASQSRFNGMTEGAKITYTYKNNKCMCSLAGVEGEKDCSKNFPFREDVAALREKKAEEASRRERAEQDRQGRQACSEIKADYLSLTDNGDARCFCRDAGKTVLYSEERRKGLAKACKKDPAAVAQAATPASSDATVTTKTCESFPGLTTLGPESEDVGTNCECAGLKSGRTYPKSDAGAASCRAELASEAAEERQRVAAAAAAPTEPTQDLKTCVDDGLKEAQSCKDSQELAGKTCDENNLDQDAEKISNAATGAYISTKSGTGAQQECFTASLASNVGLKAIKMVKDECEVLVTSCKSKCATQVFEKYETECKPKVAGIAVNEQYYNSKSGEIKQTLGDSLTLCEGKIEKDKGVISDLFSQVGDALGKSLQCMCQLSSGATTSSKEGCNIPSVQTCETNPSAPGCRAVIGLGPCTPGSSYDPKLCSCQIEPKGAGCPGGGLSGNLNGFATGSNINNTAGNDASIGTPISSLSGSGNLDLSGLGKETGPAGNLKLEPSKGGNQAGGGPGGGGPGGGSGGSSSGEGDGSAAGGEEDGKSGIGGLLNQAKTFMSNLTGGDKNKQNGALGKAKNTKPNLDKFRPRGMASSDSIIGSKNMDIWKMMNLCTNGENCKSNVNNYIMGP